VGNRDNQLSPGPRKDRDRRLLLIDSILADLRYAFRTLAKSPAFTAVALLTLALGIGANTAIFSLVNAILMRPLPVVDPDQLVSLSLVNREGSGLGLLSYPDYKDLRDRNQVLAGLAAYRFAPVNLGRNGSNERVWGYLASGNYFDLLGVKAARGRTFSPEEDRAQGVHPVVVLSHGCFQRRFGGDSDIVGQTILLNGRPFTVIGIAPEGFTGTERIITPEIWVPSMMQSSIDPAAGGLDSRESAQWFTVGRLKPAVKVASAQAELNALAGQIVRDSSPTNEGKTVQLNPPGLVIPQARAPAGRHINGDGWPGLIDRLCKSCRIVVGARHRAAERDCHPTCTGSEPRAVGETVVDGEYAAGGVRRRRRNLTGSADGQSGGCVETAS
jgi:hypothetical protein